MTADEIVTLTRSPWIKERRERRRSLTSAEREKILSKTGECCHVCGGRIVGEWQADHVIPHAHGGLHSVENYLPICAPCNRIRWFYSPELFQLIMQLGVYAKDEIRKESPLGRQLAQLTAERFAKNALRRKPPKPSGRNNRREYLASQATAADAGRAAERAKGPARSGPRG